MQDIHDAAEYLDLDVADEQARLRAIAREAKRHDMRVRVTNGHVLVISPWGECLATRSARRLATWLGY